MSIRSLLSYTRRIRTRNRDKLEQSNNLASVRLRRLSRLVIGCTWIPLPGGP